jgi:hypothetical protein
VLRLLRAGAAVIIDCFCDYDPPEFYWKRIRRARKQHKCEECCGYIMPGEQYECVTGKWDGEVSICGECAVDRPLAAHTTWRERHRVDVFAIAMQPQHPSFISKARKQSTRISSSWTYCMRRDFALSGPFGADPMRSGMACRCVVPLRPTRGPRHARR